MCCNYCYHFKDCKKSKKMKSNCCGDCAEYEFCPFLLSKKNGKEDNALIESAEGIETSEGDADFDIFGDEELQ